MRGAIPTAPIGFGQGLRVAGICLHPSSQRAIQRSVLRVGDAHRMASVFQGPRHPFTFRTRLDQNAHGVVPAEGRDEPFPRREHLLMSQHHAVGINDANVAIPRV